jgi:outer membrane protein OmpA-like peptidoglycan-associated protein
MKRSAYFFFSTLVLATGLLAGCASQNTQDKKVASAPTPTPTPTLSPQAVKDLKWLQFEKMSAKLEPEHEKQLLQLMPLLQSSKSIVLRGYCNKKEVGNAKDGAIARAAAVEKFLQKQGIPDKKMTIRFNTDDAKHAVEIDLD